MNKEERIRVKNYYEATQYIPKNINKNLKNIFDETIDVYNPVKDIVKSLINTSIKDLDVDNESLKKIWLQNNMTTFSKKICKEMYLNEEVVVEVIRTENDEIRYILHNIDEIEIVEVFGVIQKFKVEGEYIYYDENGEEQTQSYSREYIKLENGAVKKVEIIDGERFETPFILDIIPVSIFKNDSNIIGALNIIDRINENETYIRKIFNIHGDPVLFTKNIRKFADSKSVNETIKNNAEVLKEANYKSKKVINAMQSDEKEIDMKYVELANSMVTEMQNNIEKLEKRLINLFPEFLLVDNETQNVSEETYSMKNNGLRTKILSFREDFLKGLRHLDETALALSGKSNTEINYTYLDTFEESEKQSKLTTLSQMLDVIIKAKEIDEEYVLKDIVNKISQQVLKDLEDIYD